MASTPNMIVAHPSVEANSVKELIDLARAKPGYLNYASGSIGSTPHLAPELFKNMTGVNIVRFVKTTEASERFLNAGVEVVGSSPEQLAAAMKSEMTRMGKLIRDAGIRIE